MHTHGPKFYGSTVISDKGQVVIPVEARNALGYEKGEKLLVLGAKNDTLILTRVSSFKKLSEEMAERAAEINKLIQES